MAARQSVKCGDLPVFCLAFGFRISDFGFRDQITRSGLSIPSNIAEGYERNARKERARFLAYAKGSSGELHTQILIGHEIGYIDARTVNRWRSELEELSHMLYGLMRALP